MTPPNAPTAAERAGEERLAQLAKLEWDWDSYGAPPIGKRAIDCARRLMAVLSYSPQIVPTGQGGVQLEWHRDGLDLDLTIPPEGATEFFASPPDDDSALLAARRENETLRTALRQIAECTDDVDWPVFAARAQSLARAALAATETR